MKKAQCEEKYDNLEVLSDYSSFEFDIHDEMQLIK